ncbi:hypothetical protein RFI_26337 [Reticulomyxa filosa]|uniref:Uncharacterized protein n=1 Tax=Reticulomyxa filosa TaxID=46433 RepID=X6MAK2_RETFI|nr:hypothetical protein RFI_26337 [Reticulomyxa filosa]|eukprot:ETO11038.1 hypothetical protein RFI_26337 [Reticulomyxa filosa]
MKFSSHYYYHNHYIKISLALHQITVLFVSRTSRIINHYNYSMNMLVIEFLSFNSGRYLCSVLVDKTNDNNTGCNRYTICSGLLDKSIRILNTETTKHTIVFKGHENAVNNVKYESNELGINDSANIILSGSFDKSVHFWDIRSNMNELYVINEDKKDK